VSSTMGTRSSIRLTNRDEMDLTLKKKYEGIYIHVSVLKCCSALLLNVPGEELTDGLFSFLMKSRKRRLFQTPK
jgi:hypothetical protein